MRLAYGSRRFGLFRSASRRKGRPFLCRPIRKLRVLCKPYSSACHAACACCALRPCRQSPYAAAFPLLPLVSFPRLSLDFFRSGLSCFRYGGQKRLTSEYRTFDFVVVVHLLFLRANDTCN